MTEIQPGMKAYVRFGHPRDHQYTGPLVIDSTDGFLIRALDPDDPDEEVQVFHRASRKHIAARSQTLVLEGTPEYGKATELVEYEDVVTNAQNLVNRWSHDKTNAGLALQASEALRVLASTPEPAPW